GRGADGREDARADHGPDPEHHEVERAQRALEAGAAGLDLRDDVGDRLGAEKGAQIGPHDSMRVFRGRSGARKEPKVLVVMRQGATSLDIDGVVRAIETRGYKAHPIPGAQRTAIGITGNRGTEDRPVFESMPGVLEVIPVTHAYKLVSREVKPEDSVVKVGGVPVGGG